MGSAGSNGAGVSGPRISSITYPGDNTAADTVGGETITLTGANFGEGAMVVINGNAASIVSVVSSTTITFTSPPNPTGSYILYVVNTDGSTTIAVPGLQYSGTPAWTTAAGSLITLAKNSNLNITVAATGDAPITYAVTSGALPSGVSLNGNTGVISGTTPDVSSNTTYTFTIRATDAQRQDTDRSFSIVVQPILFNYDSPITFSSTRNQVGINDSGNSTGTTLAEFKQYFTNSSQTLVNNAATTYINVPDSAGYLYFAVPIGGTWRILAQGGAGGISSQNNRVYGATVGADFVLNGGDVLWISVGHGGGNGSTAGADQEGAGGGGATVVAKSSSTSQTFDLATMTPLLMAAGGHGQQEGYRGGGGAPQPSSNNGAQPIATAAGWNSWLNKGFNGIGSSFGGVTVYGGFGGGNSADDGYGNAGGWDALNSNAANSYIQPGNTNEVRTNNGLSGGQNNGTVRLSKL